MDEEPPPFPVPWVPVELWTAELVELDGEMEDGFKFKGIAVVPEVGMAEVSVTIRGEKTRPSLSKLYVV